MHPTRRNILRQAAIGGAVLAVASPLVRAASPNSQMLHASIGNDGMGWVDLNAIDKDDHVRVVALCDVDQTRQQQAAAKLPEARRYQDWRQLLDEEQDRIDSVNIAVPDHMHAPIAISAMQLGKHIYCQKPLTHSVHEARQMPRFAAQHNVITQMGIQGHARVSNRLIVRLIGDGVIGKVTAVHIWIPHPGDVYPQGLNRPAHTNEPPLHLDWDRWIGVAPHRPYTAVHPPDSPHAGKPVYHPFYWRAWEDFGTGALGDIGCHAMDPVFSALKLGAPTAIRSEGPPPNGQTYPLWSVVNYEFAATPYTAGRALPLTWYNGGRHPSPDIYPEADRHLFDERSGMVIIGEQGILTSGGSLSAPRLLPTEKFKDLRYPDLEPQDHYLQWTTACLGRDTAAADFSYAGPLTEAVLLGNIAMHYPDQTLQWDAAAGRITNIEQANGLLRRDYRDGWQIPGL